jgi:hypothetical protein
MKANLSLKVRVFCVLVNTELRTQFSLTQSRRCHPVYVTAIALRTPRVRTIRAWLNGSSCLTPGTIGSNVIYAHF